VGVRQARACAPGASSTVVVTVVQFPRGSHRRRRHQSANLSGPEESQYAVTWLVTPWEAPHPRRGHRCMSACHPFALVYGPRGHG